MIKRSTLLFALFIILSLTGAGCTSTYNGTKPVSDKSSPGSNGAYIFGVFESCFSVKGYPGTDAKRPGVALELSKEGSSDTIDIIFHSYQTLQNKGCSPLADVSSLVYMSRNKYIDKSKGTTGIINFLDTHANPKSLKVFKVKPGTYSIKNMVYLSGETVFEKQAFGAGKASITFSVSPGTLNYIGYWKLESQMAADSAGYTNSWGKPEIVSEFTKSVRTVDKKHPELKQLGKINVLSD